ncbi:MAG: twin-arginine translocase TatA/TatE family subunit [Dehalococcoidia bacterium]
MDFFGIGILEVLAVLLLIAIVFGPNRLPEIAGQFGRAIRELREYARDFRDEYLTDFEEIKEEYLEVRHELRETDASLREELREAEADIRSAVRDAEADAGLALKEAQAAATGSAAPGQAAAAVEPPAPAAAAAAATAVTPPPKPGERPRTSPRRRFARPGASPARPANVISINRRRQRGS